MSKYSVQPHPVVRSKFSPQGGFGISFEGEVSRTHQSCRDECNINLIMAKYAKTGLISHVNRFQGRYDNFLDATDYQTSINNVMQAQEMFDELPSAIRKKFNNDPAEFLTFVANPQNRDEMISMGLIDKNLTTESGQNIAPAAAVATTSKPEGI